MRGPTAVKQTLAPLLAHGPWQAASLRWVRQRLVVLAYHGVPNRSQFASHLDLLLEMARPVSLPEIIACARHGARLPPHPVLVTFDDGEISILEHALPELQKRQIPAVAFVVADAIGTSVPHWWDEVIALVGAGGVSPVLPHAPSPQQAVRHLKLVPDTERRKALDGLRATASIEAPRVRHLTTTDLLTLESGGVAIGNHTASHPCLNRCAGDVIMSEIRGGRDRLAAFLGHPPLAFAYPNGDQDPRVRHAVEEAGHEVAFCFDHRTSPIPPPDPFLISRVRIDAAASIERFATILSGLHSTAHRLLRRP